MQPVMGMGSFNPYTLARDSLLYRVRMMAGPQRCWLAVRITATTIDPATGQRAVPCPTCWDPDRHEVTRPNDPTCFGTGFIIPATVTTPQQGGYLNPIPIDAVVVQNENRTQQTDDGIVQYSEDRLYLAPGDHDVKKDDVVVRVIPPSTVTTRFVVADVDDPQTLGGQVVMHHCAVEMRDPADIIYRLAVPDLSGPVSGTWT